MKEQSTKQHVNDWFLQLIEEEQPKELSAPVNSPPINKESANYNQLQQFIAAEEQQAREENEIYYLTQLK